MVRHGTKALKRLQTVRYRNIAGACSEQARKRVSRPAERRQQPRRPGEASTMGESMIAGRSDRRPVRIRRRGRHTIPSQVEKVAQQAGKAAPAVAIAGALVAAPQAHTRSPPPPSRSRRRRRATRRRPGQRREYRGARRTATLDSFATRTVTVAAAKPARHAAAAQSTYYIVRSGDTLSKIASRYYHNAGDWQYLYHENDKTVSEPEPDLRGRAPLHPGHRARALHAHRLRAEARQGGSPRPRR